MNQKVSCGHFNFKIGTLSLTSVTDGHLEVMRERPVITSESSSDQIEAINRSQATDKLLENSFLPVEYIDAALNMLIIKTPDQKVILVDTGFGYIAGQIPPGTAGRTIYGGKLKTNLAGAGIQPDEITDIILTHAHIDHLGGILNADGTLAFKNAAIHMSAVEYKFWLSESPDFSKSKTTNSSQSISLARHVLTNAEKRILLFNDGEILFGCIKVIIAPGHTPGQAMLKIFSGDEQLLHIVDVAYNAEIVFAHPDWGTALDQDYDQAIATRKKVFENLALSRSLAFGCHLPWPGLGHVKNTANAYEWVVKSFSTPQLFD